MTIPITAVRLGPEVEESVLAVLRSGQLAQGPKVAELESLFCEVAGTAHAVAVSSGTTALVLALEALELEPGHEVLTSPFTFVATVNAALEAGANVRFVDISADFTVAAADVAAALTPATRVVMPVHLYGFAADMPGIADAVAGRSVAVVEDAAQAHGAEVAGRRVGSWGLGCFSLYATKNVMAGEGGVVTTSDDALADRMRVLRNQGMRARYQYEVPGHNYRLTDLQAAVAVPQVARLAEINAAREANALRLNAGLDGIEGLVLPCPGEPGRHVWHQYTVRVTSAARLDRDALAAFLAEHGVGSGVYYPRPVYDYDCYRQHPRVHWEPMPNAERAGREVLSLPVHPLLSASDVDRIVEVVREGLHA